MIPTARLLPSSPFVLAAMHMGPYHSVAPLEAALAPAFVVWVVGGIAREYRQARNGAFLDLARIETEHGGLDRFIETVAPKAVVRGSSESDGINVEALLASAAAAHGIPVFAVEDFPGSFWPRAGERLDGLFVEDVTAASLQPARGVPVDRIYPFGNPRYDALRDVDRAAKRAETRTVLGFTDEPAVLWLAQPDGGRSYRTFEVLLPHLKRAGAAVLFRAHPRGASACAARYAALLSATGLVGLDVSGIDDIVGLCCASDLVATQFSSVAVEAAYLGTPALFVLLPELGGDHLTAKKGYATPPWCESGSAFLITDETRAPVIVERALHDAEARRGVLDAFARHYAQRPAAAPRIARVILEAVGG